MPKRTALIVGDDGRRLRRVPEAEALGLLRRGGVQVSAAGATLVVRVGQREVRHRWSPASMGFGMNGAAVNWGATR